MSTNLTEANKLIAGSREGWDTLSPEATEKQRAEAAQKQYEQALTFGRAFLTPEGAACLQALRERFKEPPTWPPSVTHQQDQMAFGYIREGQKSVIKLIENALEIIKNPPKVENSNG